MAAVLRIYGTRFDVAEARRAFGPAVIRDWQAGERGSKTAGVNIGVSAAAVGDLCKQAADSVAFLHANEDALFATLAAGAEGAVLDFAVAWHDTFTHTDHLSPALVAVAAQFGLGIDVSHYPLA